MELVTCRSSIQALFTIATDLGISRTFAWSPKTLPTGRTVGRIWSSIGTSLTVYLSSWVMFESRVASDAWFAGAACTEAAAGVCVGAGVGTVPAGATCASATMPNERRRVAGTAARQKPREGRESIIDRK